MVEAFAVASGKGGTGKTTTTVALGMALAEEYDVTVVDADTGMANLLFHTGLTDADVTLHDLLIDDDGADSGTGADDTDDVAVEDAVYERFGMSVVPCGTSLDAFEAADPDRLRAVVAELAADTDVLLLDSPAALGSKSAVLPVVLADRVVVVLQPTIPALSDGLKVQEYAHSYGTDTAGVVFNKVHDPEATADVAEKTERYFDGATLATVPDSDAVRAARREGVPLLEHAPDSAAAAAYREAGATLDVQSGESDDVAERFRSAVVPDSP
jgi:septum site-determining protein MinD